MHMIGYEYEFYFLSGSGDFLSSRAAKNHLFSFIGQKSQLVYGMFIKERSCKSQKVLELFGCILNEID